MNKKTKILIVAFATILVLLALTSLLLSRSSQKSATQNTEVSPVPTQVYESSRIYKDVATSLSSDEQARLDSKIDKNNPLKTDDFDIAYSDLVGQYIVSEKTKDAPDQFLNWLQNNNLLDIFQDHPGLFAETNESLSDYLNQVKNSYSNPSRLPKQSKFSDNGTNQNKDLGLLVNLMKTLLSFNLGVQESSSSGQNGGESGGGGTPRGDKIHDRTVGNTAVPQRGTLSPVEIAAAAVIARYGKSSSSTLVDWNWVTEAVAVGLAESGGYCCSGRTDTNSWGLWQVDAGNARMNVPNTALYDPLIDAKAMWNIQGREVAQSQREYGTNWGAYWSTGRPGANRFFKNSEFYNPGQKAAAELKSQL